jgi:hypothetical protein
MPVIPTVLSALIQTNINANLAALNGQGPLAQKDPSYFIAMCTAIGTGIATGSPLITFTSSDTGMMGVPPIPGAGTGVGIVVDGSFFEQDLYTRIRGFIIADFGSTTHDAYPPGPMNSGQNLLAVCKGVSDAIVTNFATAWTLTSVDPTIYIGSGMIQNGDFSGLVATAVSGPMVSAAPTLKGAFWPRICQGIAESYVAAIEQHSTGSITLVGVCVPSLAQVCGLPSSGTGTGTAV